MSSLEEELATIDTQLADPALYSGDPSAARELHEKRASLQSTLEESMERWEALAERA